jgi:hypothetical protein
MSEACNVAFCSSCEHPKKTACGGALFSSTRSRKVVPEDAFRSAFDLFHSCRCAQAKRARAEMTRENSERKRYRGKMTTKKTPTLRFIAASLCAVSRLMVSLVQPGRTQRKVLGSPHQPGAERRRGKEHVMESGDEPEVQRNMRRKTRALWQELNCPKSTSRKQ